MSLLDFIFGGGRAKKTGKLFATSWEIEKTLFSLGILNQKQRALVKSVLIKYLGSGGVSVEEFRTRVLPELYKLIEKGKISSVDYQKIKSLMYK
jgi:hypothetical protein